MGKLVESPDDAFARCIARCLECYRVCVETLRHSLERGGPHTKATHIRLLLDCIDICRLSADFMLRVSDFHVRICGVCAEVCQRCAEDAPDSATTPSCSAARKSAATVRSRAGRWREMLQPPRNRRGASPGARRAKGAEVGSAIVQAIEDGGVLGSRSPDCHRSNDRPY
jgi:hypothetical protein